MHSHSAYWLPTRKKLLYTVANPARGLLNREKKKKKVWQRTPPHPPLRCSFGEALRRSRSVSRPYKDTFDSSARPMGVTSQNSSLPCAITTFPVLLPLLSSSGDIQPRLPVIFSTRPRISAHPPRPSQPTPQPSTPSLSNPSLCQTPGFRSVRNRSTLPSSFPHPVLQYNGGLLPDIILLNQCYHHRGIRLHVMKRFCLCSLWSHLLNVLTFSPLAGGCSEGLEAFRFFLKQQQPQPHIFVHV